MLFEKRGGGEIEWNRLCLLSDERPAWKGKRLLRVSLGKVSVLKRRKLAELGKKEHVTLNKGRLIIVKRGGKKAIWWLLRTGKKELHPFNSLHGSVLNRPLWNTDYIHRGWARISLSMSESCINSNAPISKSHGTIFSSTATQSLGANCVLSELNSLKMEGDRFYALIPSEESL